MHVPVLLKETIEWLNPRSNENFVDCTLGEAGHAAEILKRTGPRGRLLGIDQDARQIAHSQAKLKEFGERAILAHDNFVNLQKIVEKKKFGNIKGVLVDLGISSWHIEESQKGFSFLKEEQLDMRLDENQKLTAREIVNAWPEERLAQALKDLGQERWSQRIARQIVRTRKVRAIETTAQLAQIVSRACPPNYERGRIHPATRTFLTLRVLVNDELLRLESLLPQALQVLQKEGRLVVISFNSAEDRLVKNFCRDQAKSGQLKILTPHPVVAEPSEREANPRSRSAKLRVAAKTHDHFNPSPVRAVR